MPQVVRHPLRKKLLSLAEKLAGIGKLILVALGSRTAGGNCLGSVTASSDSLSSDPTCALPGTVYGPSVNNLDPLLTALGAYGGPTLVHMLKHNSPAIDGVAGNNAPGTDQRGFPRPQGGYDIGAVERQPGDSDLAPWLYLPLVRR